VLPIVGASVTEAARHTAHLASLIVDGIVILALCFYVLYKSRDRYYNDAWSIYGPTILCFISYPFILADPLRHVLSDNNIWQSCNRRCGEVWPPSCDWSSSEYHCALVCDVPGGCDANDPNFLSCTCVHDFQETMPHLSMIGWIFTIFCTYCGYLLFMTGALWSANIIDKCREIRHKWRVLRGDSQDDNF